MGKPFWKSRTYWFNALMGLIALLNELVPIIDQLANAGLDPSHIAKVRALVAFVLVIGNMVLRAITTEPVTMR